MILEGKKILLVEDDIFIGDMLVRKLMVEGALCVQALNGQEGLSKFNENNGNFDAILTDIMMSKMDGYEFVVELKKDSRAQSLPIIDLTNKSSVTPQTERIKELGIDGMFIKSSTALHELMQEIAKIIEKKQAEKVH